MFSRVSQLLIKNYMMMVMISIITTQRYASMGYAVIMCLSVTSQYCTKWLNVGSQKQRPRTSFLMPKN